MFVEYATEVEASLGQVEKRLEGIRSDIEGWANTAYREGEQLRARVGPGGAIAHEVRLEIGGSEIRRSGLVYPVHWTAQGAALLFPELNADLILSKVGSRKTQLTLRGTYQPPMGAFGRLVDRVVLGRVAHATVADWIDRLAEALSPEVRVG